MPIRSAAACSAGGTGWPLITDVQVLDCGDGGKELLPWPGRCCPELIDEMCPFFSVGLLSPLHLCVRVGP